METFFRDLRYSVRMLTKSPGFHGGGGNFDRTRYRCEHYSVQCD